MADPVREALARVSELQAHARAATEPGQAALAHQEAAALLVAIRHFDDAREELGQARRGFEEAGDPRAAAGTWYQQGIMEARQGEGPRAARRCLTKALEGFTSAGDRDLTGRTHAHLATLALDNNDLERADEHLRQAAEAFASNQDAAKVMDALRYRTVVLQLMGRPLDAHKVLTHSLAIARHYDDEANALQVRLDLHNLESNALVSADLRSESIDAIMRDAEKAGKAHFTAHVLLARAAERARDGDHAGALEDAQAARQAALQVTDPILYTMACLSVAELEELLGNRLGVLNILFTCARSLADLLGEEARAPVHQVLDSRRKKWGEDAWQALMVEYRAQFKA